jgi:hypothetical protein
MAVETTHGEAEARERGRVQADLRGSWHGPLMEAVAESFFVHVSIHKNKEQRKWDFTLIGRPAAVASVAMTYEYLNKAIDRIYKATKPPSHHQFFCGAAERLGERLKERHAKRLREEAERKSREQAARSSQAPSSSTALVVTLVDYEQREQDLNDDFRFGREPGTTQRQREADRARAAAKEARYKELLAQGIPDGVAWNMAYIGQSLERATEYQREWEARQEKQQNRGWTKGDEERWRRERDRQFREAQRRSTTSWRSGREAGDTVGLDQQVDKQERKKLS